MPKIGQAVMAPGGVTNVGQSKKLIAFCFVSKVIFPILWWNFQQL